MSGGLRPQNILAKVESPFSGLPSCPFERPLSATCRPLRRGKRIKNDLKRYIRYQYDFIDKQPSGISAKPPEREQQERGGYRRVQGSLMKFKTT